MGRLPVRLGSCLVLPHRAVFAAGRCMWSVPRRAGTVCGACPQRRRLPRLCPAASVIVDASALPGHLGWPGWPRGRPTRGGRFCCGSAGRTAPPVAAPLRRRRRARTPRPASTRRGRPGRLPRRWSRPLPSPLEAPAYSATWSPSSRRADGVLPPPPPRQPRPALRLRLRGRRRSAWPRGFPPGGCRPPLGGLRRASPRPFLRAFRVSRSPWPACASAFRRLFDDWFPDADKIVDFYHAAEYLWAAARARHDAGDLAEAWAKKYVRPQGASAAY